MPGEAAAPRPGAAPDLPLRAFYAALRFAFDRLYGRQQMLHYPLCEGGTRGLAAGQAAFTEACLARLGPLEGRRVLDVGCGNGLQTLHLARTRRPARVVGIDFNAAHVAMAREAAAGAPRVAFEVDDAQTLASVADGSVDAALCVESAHHYPDKDLFLANLRRVLAPGGRFVIADLLLRDDRRPGRLDRRLTLHHWRLDRYRTAAAAAGLRLEAAEDVTARLLAGFENPEGWLEPEGRAGPAARAAARLIARGLIRLYRHELRHRFRYVILSGGRA